MSTSSAFTSAPSAVFGSGNASISLPDAPARMALRIASISAVFVAVMVWKLPAGSGGNHPSLHCPSSHLAHSSQVDQEAPMTGSVIVGSARTPIGKLSGALSGFSGAELGGLAIKSALERAGVGAEQV